MNNLYIINFLLATSTTIGMTVIPLLSVEIVGVSLFIFALIEGIGEFLSSVIKLLSGYLFDRIKNKKILFILASVLAFLSKLLLIFPNLYTLISTKILERFSNGFFATPRDAFLGLKAKNKGVSLGVLNSFRAAGCVFGSLITSFYLVNEISIVLIKNLILLASSLCVIAFILSYLIPSFSDKLDSNSKNNTNTKISSIQIIKENKNLYFIILLFFCARFNDGLIILFLKNKSIPSWFYLSNIGIFNSISFLVSPFLGMVLDSKHRIVSLYITFTSLIIFNFIFLSYKDLNVFIAFFALMFWGIQRVGSQICFTNLLFNTVSREKYGRACGIMNIFVGIGTIVASTCCGYLSTYSFIYVFVFSGLFSLMSLLLFYHNKKIINAFKDF